jgi:DNA-binding NtrC family response regulator
MTPPLPLVVHEPQTSWGRQLRARGTEWPVRLHETRSLDDLIAALRRAAFGLLLVDAGDRPLAALDHLAHAAPLLGGWLVLFVDAAEDPDRATLARALGATHVVARPVPPPEVAALLRRWVDLALDRRARAGWLADIDPAPDAWLTELVPALRSPSP